ncbi:DUF4249 domain-containing protein [uncultured Allomuricauda sp.]|uniref:DUF4249 domain-containing protein n=1 Tax=Flagellimonas sp. W118 TaxID=3410791 RepID=UPI00260CF0D5|nr:DUF4249 domain-containing protein [uncultured Allomuricauda sp.]
MRIANFKLFLGIGLITCLVNNGCVEPFQAEFENFESALVVEATLTNELKQQEVFLSRTFEFEEEEPLMESNAQVRVVAGGNTFVFDEASAGTYVSAQAFAAQPNTAYQLLVTTQDGRSYSSDEVTLSPTTQIDGVRAERIINDDGEDGIAILVDSFDPSGSAKNYRYVYEESYRIIAPDWAPMDLIGDPAGGCGVLKIPKQRDEQVCYTTDLSNEIILTNTTDLEEDRVSNFMVRFLNRNNYIISHRYSILVKQLVHSNIAYTFYERLDEFSSSESLLSETQPGFLQGNMFSNENRNEKVLGFFDVASITEQRIFFNYEDFYPEEPLPPYADPCGQSAPVLINQGGLCVLRPIIEANVARFKDDNSIPQVGEGPFFIVPRVCGDCTVLGDTEIPEFWEE